MAVDKLIDSEKESACRTAEANAIRAKTGSTDIITYDFANGKGFADAIENISGSVVEVPTAAQMDAKLTVENVGKVFVYTGANTDNYTTGDYYKVEYTL